MDLLHFKSGTDIRGIASEGVPNQPIDLTDEVIEKIATGYLVWCEKKTGKKASELKLAMGHDSRISADRISTALCKVFTACGATVYHCGLASTPSMFMAVLELPCDASVEITASHHPFNRNGLKFFTKDGGLEGSDISEILNYAMSGNTPEITNSGKVEKSNYMQQYASNLREMIKKGVNADNYNTPLQGFKIIVDAGNGAGGFYAENVLAPLGANTDGSQFLEPDGTFPNHVPNPEDKEAIESISKATIMSKADLGIIFDTDVDRGGAVASDGNEINRNTLIALASAIALEDNQGATVVTDSTTSDGLKEYIETTLGGKHHRFKRGYKNVINEAIRLNKEGVNCPLAIETSGHAALRENYFLDDGAYLVTKIVIKMAQLKKENRDINDLLKSLKHPYEENEIRLTIDTADFKTYGNRIIADFEAYCTERNYAIANDNHEGIRVSFDSTNGDGWVLLRMSVHDPVMPVNIESNVNGGNKIIANILNDFLTEKSYDKLNINALTNFLQ